MTSLNTDTGTEFTPDIDVVVEAPEAAPKTTTFAELGVREEIVRALAEGGIEHTFAIQELTLPLALTGNDLIGQARTGMGKTFAFGVPLLHRIVTDESRPLTGIPRALIVVPTRELCLQVYDDLANAARYLRVDPHGPGDRKLSVTSHLRWPSVRTADRRAAQRRRRRRRHPRPPARPRPAGPPAARRAVGAGCSTRPTRCSTSASCPTSSGSSSRSPTDRQAMLFSATMPDPIITLARTFMNQPTHIRAEAPHSAATHENTTQHAYRAHALDKVEMVARILQANGRGATMIFTPHQAHRPEGGRRARRARLPGPAPLHGDLGQGAREKALKGFRTGEVDVLVATDVAARGIDIDDITHVINYQIPEDEQAYVHRIGRTGRAGKTGIAVTLVDWDELPRWTMIDKALGLNNPRPRRDVLELAASLHRTRHPVRGRRIGRQGHPLDRVQGPAAARAAGVA